MNKISPKQYKRMSRLAKMQPPKDGKCTRCGEYPDFRGLQKHHKVARSQGGKDSLSNIEWICAKCHGEKHRVESMPKSKPVDKARELAGYTTQLRAYPKSAQCGTK